MKKCILLIVALIACAFYSHSQVTIATWESGTSPTLAGDAGVNPLRIVNSLPEGVNTSNYVMSLTTLSGNNYENAWTEPPLGSYISFAGLNAISAKVRSSVAGNVVLKIAKYGFPATYLTAAGYYYATGYWQDMKFYFPGAASGTYNVVAVFPDYEGGARAGTWYIDDIRTINMVTPFSDDTIVNNDSQFRYFQAWSAADPEVVLNPAGPAPNNINPSTKCLKFTSTANQGEGIKHTFESSLDFSSKNTISVMVYSPENIGIIELRLEGPGVSTIVSKYQYTTPGLWQKLTFDLTGTQTNAYNLLAIVPDYTNTTAGIDWYFDEITFEQETIGTFESDIIADFDNHKRIFENNGGTGGISEIANPVTDGINPSARVLQVLTTSGNQWEAFGTTLERKLDFESSNAMSVLVYSNVSGVILLKLQGKDATPVEVFRTYTATNPATWQRVRFDMSAAATNTYNDIQIFPDFSQARNGTWLFDELKTENIPLQGNIIVNFDEFDDQSFEDWGSTGGFPKVPNPYKEAGINTSNTVLNIITVSSQEEGVKTTVNGLDFSNNNSISCKVYSPSNSGIVQLRLEGPEVPVITSNYQYTNPGHWQVLTFDLTEAQANPSAYNLIAIRPDYGGTTPDILWYFDDFTIDNTTITPFNESILANFDDVPRIFGQHYTNGINYVSNPAPDEINATTHVLDMISSTNPAESVYDARERNLDFSTKNAISINVLSSNIGLVHLKLINGSNSSYPPFHAECQYTDKDQWQKLTFDLRGASTNVYNLIQVFPGIEDTTTDIHWYLDEFTFETAEFLPYALDTIVNFDGVQKVFRQWDTKGFGIADNPFKAGINLSNHVIQVYTSSSASSEGIKTVLDRNLDFSQAPSNFINVNVYSTASGSVQLTLEGKGVETKAFNILYTASNPAEWKTLSFDVSGLATDAYNLVALLPDATGNSDNKAWYFDDIAIERNDGLVLYADWDGTTTGSFIPSGSGATITQVVNPITTGNGINVGGKVLQLVNSVADEGAMENIGRYIDFSVKSEFHVDYYSTVAGTIRMQLEGTGVSTSTSPEVNYTSPGQWQELTFEFNNPKTDVYNYLSILPATSGTWYIDNIKGPELSDTPIITSTMYADWELISPARSKVWGGLTDTIKPNPLIAGINQTANALKVTTRADSLWEGFSIDCSAGVFDFSDGRTFALDVYSTVADTVLLKLENTSVTGIDPVQLYAQYTKPGIWQQLVFTFDSLLLSSFNRMAIFPDINGAGTADWYFDNIQGPRSVDKTLILKAPGGIAEGREEGKFITVYLFGETFKSSPWDISNFTIAGLTSPVTVGNVTMIDNHRAIIELSQNSDGPALIDDSPVIVTIKKEQLSSGLQDISGGGISVIAIGDYLGTRAKKVFVHYLPWYNDTIIRENVPAYQGWRDLEHKLPDSIVYSNSPLIGEYSQLDEDVLEYQFLTMYAAGIDGLIINLVPSREYEKVIVMKCLNKLKEMNEQYAGSGFSLKFIVSYDEKDPSENVEESFLYVRDSLTNNPKFNSFYFYDTETSKPVIITWDQLHPELYHPILKELYNDSVIHLVRDDAEFVLSDGNMEWVNYLDTVNSPVGNTNYWGENYYNNFHLQIARQDSLIAFKDRNYLCMGAVWPGFDDHNAPWRENKPDGRWMSRNVTEGETIALTFDKLNSSNYVPGALGNIKVEIPWVQVATWNDWPEGTSIEPATMGTYGYQALKTTSLRTAEFKGSSIDTSRVRIPYAIYQARKNYQPEVALCLIDQLLSGSSYTEAINACNSGYCKYIPMPVFSQMENDQYSGAACAKMILDLEGSNTLTQTDIQNYAINHNYSMNIGQPFIDPYGMYRVLNYNGMAGYNYGQLTKTTRQAAYNDLCYWISNNIPNVNNTNMPSVVPTGGNYNNWMIVNGFRSSANPHSTSSYTVYGFYIKDPNVNGIGQDIYIQADAFGTSYFKPITSSDIWNGKYVTVDEPPVNNAVVSIQPLQPYGTRPANNNLRFLAAEEGLKYFQLLNNDGNIINAMNGASRGRIHFVNLPGEFNDYYIVTFEKDGGCALAAIIDANNGALKEVSFTGTPDKNYYDNLKTLRTGLKSSDEEILLINSFYPAINTVSTAIETDRDAEANAGFDFMLIPNPASDQLNILVNSPSQGDICVELYSITGVLIDKVELSDHDSNGSYPVNIQRLEKGIYIVNVVLNGERRFKKLVIGD